MNPNEYQKSSERTQCDYVKALERIKVESENDTLKAIRVNHAVVGLIGELGEIASVLQKWIYYGKPFSVEELRTKLTDEGGDCFWYLALLLNAIDVPMEKVLIANIEKLKARYPEKFTEALAEVRDRDKEDKAIKEALNKNTKTRKSLGG